MPVHNSDVAEIFNRIADFLEIKGENPFRIRAYRDAARKEIRWRRGIWILNAIPKQNSRMSEK